MTSEMPPARFFNGSPKYVVSNTLTDPSWSNTSVISGDVKVQIEALKQQPGRDIQLTGSATLVRSLLTLGLIDELNLLVSPVAIGSGALLFDGLDSSVVLKATDANTLPNGVAHLVYKPASVD